MIPLFVGGGGWRVPPVFVSFHLSSIQMIKRFNRNSALTTQSCYLCNRIAILKVANERKMHPAALSPYYCSSDKRFELVFFYLVSRTRISSVHEPERELIPLPCQTFFSTCRPIKYSFHVRTFLHAQADKDLPQSRRAVHDSARSTEKSRHRTQTLTEIQCMTAVADRTTGLLTFAWRACD
jgi:hypothetical protein